VKAPIVYTEFTFSTIAAIWATALDADLAENGHKIFTGL
jgi:hypothetical protein